MSKPRYTAIIDGREAYTADHIKYLKEQVQFEFDYLNAYFAEIRTGNKVVSTKFYDGEWRRTLYDYDKYH